ncbi:glutamate racemase [Sphingobium sp.]|uniref:glutamate racemase n=1 Tax=Sphingobium sp. TaxID=1912891 RepID=UPI003BB4DD4A
MTVAPNAPILFFDSGVGGLSILAPARAALPTAPIIYAADSAGFPYGTKSEDEIAARVPALLGRLVERYRPRLAVIACNTASTIALRHVRAALDIPVVGTVPAIKPAALLSKSRVFGVLGTDATVRQPYVDRLAAEHGADCIVLRYGSGALVALAEAKLRGQPLDPAVARGALAGLLDQPGGDRMDVVALACTHFPLVEPELAAAAPHPIIFVHGGEGIARRIAFLTQGQPWPAHATAGTAVFTRVDDDILTLAPALARYGLDRIEQL